ncbi:hypothetical protein MAPG_07281 [Magnaporthiopsis poae ATCC 64411]|uniref:Uncharacterized protein n=1 Tax=Magnaporthiopsis poae (strain ATCC 64411 / 73-15) TaxID=644358 RepID=A0A0C4E490_MAGP6|nr:hypothetical protein MAPG_07281 [Magnaporthiopsis poae ATCC 64411]
MSSHKRHQKPKSLGGLFMWLPPYHRIQDKEYPTKYGGEQLQKAAYNHPVVVVSSKEESDGAVVVLLACGGSGRLAKDSYVVTHPLVRAKFAILLEYDDVLGGTWAKRLDTKSYHQLQKFIQFIEPAAPAHAALSTPKAASSSARGQTPDRDKEGTSIQGIQEATGSRASRAGATKGLPLISSSQVIPARPRLIASAAAARKTTASLSPLRPDKHRSLPDSTTTTAASPGRCRGWTTQHHTPAVLMSMYPPYQPHPSLLAEAARRLPGPRDTRFRPYFQATALPVLGGTSMLKSFAGRWFPACSSWW